MGRVGKPHGVRGWAHLVSTTDEPERRFAPGARVLIDGVEHVIAESRVGVRIAVRFEGCTDREQAQALRGQWLYVAADSHPPADPDEFYDHQLEGLTVRVAGQPVGVVAEVLHLPGQDVLAVDCDGRQVLVPFVEQIVPEVDLAGGSVTVHPVEGLFDDAH